MKNLEHQISELNENLAKQLPSEVLEVFGKSIQDLKAKKLEDGSIKVGDRFPDFSLPNTNKKIVVLKELLQKGKVIIAFFRGNWCPYCNLELKAFQDDLKQIEDKNVTLIAISPQSSNHSEELKNNHNLGFELLTDKNNALAKQLGIAFELQNYAISTYSSLGIELSEYNNNDTNELPVPAVFVIDKNGSITYKFIDSNYMNRINIKELMRKI